jgi:hypothetical protein
MALFILWGCKRPLNLKLTELTMWFCLHDKTNMAAMRIQHQLKLVMVI